MSNASKDVLVDNTKMSGLYGMDYDFSVDYDNTNVDIYKYLMKKHDIKSFLDKLW